MSHPDVGGFVSEQPPARDCTDSSHSWCSNAMGFSGKGPFWYPKESDLCSWKAKKCRQWEADDAEILLFWCSPSEGRCVCCALSHWNLFQLQWVSKEVGNVCLLLVEQKRPMCRAFTASISRGISNESELTPVFKSKIWLWLSNASYI